MRSATEEIVRASAPFAVAAYGNLLAVVILLRRREEGRDHGFWIRRVGIVALVALGVGLLEGGLVLWERWRLLRILLPDTPAAWASGAHELLRSSFRAWAALLVGLLGAGALAFGLRSRRLPWAAALVTTWIVGAALVLVGGTVETRREHFGMSITGGTLAHYRLTIEDSPLLHVGSRWPVVLLPLVLASLFVLLETRRSAAGSIARFLPAGDPRSRIVLGACAAAAVLILHGNLMDGCVGMMGERFPDMAAESFAKGVRTTAVPALPAALLSLFLVTWAFLEGSGVEPPDGA